MIGATSLFLLFLTTTLATTVSFTQQQKNGTTRSNAKEEEEATRATATTTTALNDALKTSPMQISTRSLSVTQGETKALRFDYRCGGALFWCLCFYRAIFQSFRSKEMQILEFFR